MLDFLKSSKLNPFIFKFTRKVMAYRLRDQISSPTFLMTFPPKRALFIQTCQAMAGQSSFSSFQANRGTILAGAFYRMLKLFLEFPEFSHHTYFDLKIAFKNITDNVQGQSQ